MHDIAKFRADQSSRCRDVAAFLFLPRGARDARVIAIIVCLYVCLCLCHTPVLYQNG